MVLDWKMTSTGLNCKDEAVDFHSGNPMVETTEGIIHLYKNQCVECCLICVLFQDRSTYICRWDDVKHVVYFFCSLLHHSKRFTGFCGSHEVRYFFVLSVLLKEKPLRSSRL